MLRYRERVGVGGAIKTFKELCSHRFSWPRLSRNGQHYQIRLICGTAYLYDWKRMQRIARLLAQNGQNPVALVRTPLPGNV
jgi:hypothetical protein